MISLSGFARIATFSATMFSAAIASGSEAIQNALGGSIVECSGAIAWTENDGGATRVEAMRFAARDSIGTDEIALFLDEKNFSAQDVWPCNEGACTANTVLHSAVTTNVLRLRHELDLGSGEVVYGLDAVFMVVNARESPMQVEGAKGAGSFICEKALPESLVSSGQ